MTVVDDGSARRGASRRRILDDGDPTRRALRIDAPTRAPSGVGLALLEDSIDRSILDENALDYGSRVRVSYLTPKTVQSGRSGRDSSFGRGTRDATRDDATRRTVRTSFVIITSTIA